MQNCELFSTIVHLWNKNLVADKHSNSDLPRSILIPSFLLRLRIFVTMDWMRAAPWNKSELNQDICRLLISWPGDFQLLTLPSELHTISRDGIKTCCLGEKSCLAYWLPPFLMLFFFFGVFWWCDTSSKINGCPWDFVLQSLKPAFGV